MVIGRDFRDKQMIYESGVYEYVGVYERLWKIKAFSEIINILTLGSGIKLIWIFLDTFGYFWILLDIFGYFLKSIVIGGEFRDKQTTCGSNEYEEVGVCELYWE